MHTGSVLGKLGNPILLPLSSGLFSMGFFSLSFSFPLIAEQLRFSAESTGLLGLFIGLPFPVMALLMTRLGFLSLMKLVRYSIVLMVPASLLFLILNGSTFIPLLIFADLTAVTYFVAVEMGIGRSDSENLAERYSAAWGIPNLIAPAIAGFVLQSYGFDILFIVSSLFFMITVAFLPRLLDSGQGSTETRKTPSSLLLVLPMLFGGISAGFFYYVMIPHLKELGFAYFVIGIVGSIPPLFSALIFVILNKIHSQAWGVYAVLSAALLSLPAILFFNQWLSTVIIAFALTGCGSAIAFSKILAYISKTSSSSTGVLYYETLFGIGFIVGSITGGFLFQRFGYLAVLPIFVPSLVYALFLLFTHYQVPDNSSGDLAS